MWYFPTQSGFSHVRVAWLSTHRNHLNVAEFSPWKPDWGLAYDAEPVTASRPLRKRVPAPNNAFHHGADMQDRTPFLSRWLCALACGGWILLSGCGGVGGGGAVDVNPPPASVPPLGTLSLLAGAVGGPGSVDGVPGRFFVPSGLAVDAAGSVYVADRGNHTIRKITVAGVTTLAGISGQAGFRDGAGTFALFAEPSALAVDAAGNVYVADSLNAVIRKISPAGVVSSLAGSPGARGYVDDTGAAARFEYFIAMTIDSAGNLYVSEQQNNVIRKITTAGVVTTVAGGAKFSSPRGIAVDGSGNVYVAEAGNRLIRKISPAGAVTTLTGITTVELSGGFADGPPGVARFNFPNALTINSQGVLFALDSGQVRRITSDGVVTSRAARNADGSSKFFSPSSTGLALDTAGNVYVADFNAIHRLDLEGVVTTIAGTSPSSGRADGLGSAASFFSPGSLGLDNSGNVYVADIGNNAIRRITPAGLTTTVATNVGANQMQAQGVVYAAFPFFNIAGDRAGNIIVTDESSHLVRRLMPDGSLATVAGSQWPDGTPIYHPRGYGIGFADRSRPQAVAGDGLGNIYIIDGNRIRKITSAGADSFVTCGPDNTCLPPNDAFPTGIAADATGNLYVANRYAIVKITPAGTSVILAGNFAIGGYTDGSGAEAKFNLPAALAVDTFGNVFVADTRNHAVRKVTPAGLVTTIAGRPGTSGVQVGTLPASLASPTGIVVTADGTLYVSSENAVLKIQP